MCDYSLHHVASAPAKVGDKLVTTSFNMSSTRGFAVMGEPDVAICVLPGTELAFGQNVRCDRGFGIIRRKTIPHQVARFRQINMDQPYAYHDALEFPDGQVVLLTHLSLGQSATVLQLPAQTRELHEQHERERHHQAPAPDAPAREEASPRPIAPVYSAE
jgi:hypothetical protein